MKSLFDVLPANTNMTHYCEPEYWWWEDNVARPELERLGYERITFHMGEREPMTRIVRAYKNGECQEFVLWLTSTSRTC